MLICKEWCVICVVVLFVVCVVLKVGGIEEYKICDVIKSGLVIKFVVVWCIGICVGMFIFEVSKNGEYCFV